MSETITRDPLDIERKVTASAAASGLVAAIVAAIVGIMPGDPSAEVRDALTVLIDAALGLLIGGGSAFLAGYFTRSKKPKRL